MELQKGFCLPTIINIIYFFISVILSFVIYFLNKKNNKSITPIISNIIIGLIVILILFFLCLYNHTNTAWFILGIQICFSLILFGFYIGILIYNNKKSIVPDSDNDSDSDNNALL